MTSQIVQFWDQGQRIPQALLDRTVAWQIFNPEWEYLCFDAHSAANFLMSAYCDAIAEAFLDIRLAAMKADVFRVAYLLAHGGMWVDAATICTGPISGWLNVAAPLVLIRKQGMEPPLVCNGLIYARERGHPFLEDLWGHISAAILGRQGTRVWKLVGPGLYRDLLRTGRYNTCIQVLEAKDLGSYFRFSSTSQILPSAQHWSERQRAESLYFSQRMQP